MFMDIRSSLDGLRSLLGVSPSETPAAQPSNNSVRAEPSVLSRDSATVSSAGSGISLGATDSGVRMDKVASIRAALQAGTYNVPPSAVASKMVDSMLSAQ
jgi:flagellar biosynthesis anti-sigma factor FlgM